MWPNKAHARKPSGPTTILQRIRPQISDLPEQTEAKTIGGLLQAAKKFRAVSYQRVDRTLSQMKGCLADGFPFVFGFTVYDSFESAQVARTGALQMPKPREGVVGGHAVLAVGYDDKSERFTVRNSWGTSWGKRGYFTMPYSYLLTDNLSDDFWTIRLVH